MQTVAALLVLSLGFVDFNYTACKRICITPNQEGLFVCAADFMRKHRDSRAFFRQGSQCSPRCRSPPLLNLDSQPKFRKVEEFQMEFNYALERRKFEKQWKLLRKQYQEAGMDDEAIKQIYSFDLQWFNSERRYIRRQADLPEDFSVYDLPCSDAEPHVEKILPSSGPLNIPPADRHWWIDEIEDEELLCKLMMLSDEDIELLTAIVFEGKTQSEYALAKSTNQKAVSRRFLQISKILRKGV